jgi:hypothetical protein
MVSYLFIFLRDFCGRCMHLHRFTALVSKQLENACYDRTVIPYIKLCYLLNCMSKHKNMIF